MKRAVKMLSVNDKNLINNSFPLIKNQSEVIVAETILMIKKKSQGNLSLEALIGKASKSDILALANGLKALSENVFVFPEILENIKSAIEREHLVELNESDFNLLESCFIEALANSLPKNDKKCTKAWQKAYTLLITTIYGQKIH